MATPSAKEQTPVKGASATSSSSKDGQGSLLDGGEALAVCGGSNSPAVVLRTERLDSGESLLRDCATLRKAVALSLSVPAPSQGSLDSTQQAKQKNPIKKGTKKGINSVTPASSPHKGKVLLPNEVNLQLLCTSLHLCCGVLCHALDQTKQ